MLVLNHRTLIGATTAAIAVTTAVAIAFDADSSHMVNILAMSLYWAELLASFLVMRSRGYRVVTQTTQRPSRSFGDGSVGESLLT